MPFYTLCSVRMIHFSPDPRTCAKRCLCSLKLSRVAHSARKGTEPHFLLNVSDLGTNIHPVAVGDKPAVIAAMSDVWGEMPSPYSEV